MFISGPHRFPFPCEMPRTENLGWETFLGKDNTWRLISGTRWKFGGGRFTRKGLSEFRECANPVSWLAFWIGTIVPKSMRWFVNLRDGDQLSRPEFRHRKSSKRSSQDVCNLRSSESDAGDEDSELKRSFALSKTEMSYEKKGLASSAHWAPLWVSKRVISV